MAKRDQLGREQLKHIKMVRWFLNVVFVHKDRLGGDEMFFENDLKVSVILTETKDAKNLLKRKD